MTAAIKMIALFIRSSFFGDRLTAVLCEKLHLGGSIRYKPKQVFGREI